MFIYLENFKVYFFQLICLIIFVLPLILSAAALTLLERKVMGGMQRRIGCNVVGYLGTLQPISDAFKLISNECIIPKQVNLFLFILAPIYSFSICLLNFAFIPLQLDASLINLPNGALFIFAISSISVYGVL
jgi:NADH:ubiquinone oxidoreductase subunit H